MPLFTAFIVAPNGMRVATAFMLRMRVDARPWRRHYSHLYIVTALHAVFDKATGVFRGGLRIEFPWMEEQGLANQGLDQLNWRFLRVDELPDGETGLDLAIASFTGSAFTGVQFGRSARAVDEVSCQFGCDIGLLGAETVAVGLLTQHSGSPDHIEPVLRFGRVVAAPRALVKTGLGTTRALLVESSADSGMSGAPVFVNARGEWLLLGVHVGHFTSAEIATGETGRVRFDTHSSIGIVLPGERLIDDLAHVEPLASARLRVQSEIESRPWRFLDRRHRELRGVVLAECYFENMADYAELQGGPWDYLCYAYGGHDYEFTTGEEDLEWTTEVPCPLRNPDEIAAALESVFGQIAWGECESRLWRGSANTFGADGVGIDLYIDADNRVQVVRVKSGLEPLTKPVLEDLRSSLGHVQIIDLVEGYDV